MKKISSYIIFALAILYLIYSGTQTAFLATQNSTQIRQFQKDESSIKIHSLVVSPVIAVGEPLVITGRVTITRLCTYLITRYVYDKSGKTIWSNIERRSGDRLMNNEEFRTTINIGRLSPGRYDYRTRAEAKCGDRVIPLTTDLHSFEVVSK